MTVGEMSARMTSAEFVRWGYYRREFGFAVDRIEHVTANAGSAVARSFGGKVKPAQIIPRFGPPAKTSPIAVKAWLDSLTPERFWR